MSERKLTAVILKRDTEQGSGIEGHNLYYIYLCTKVFSTWMYWYFKNNKRKKDLNKKC